MTHFCALRIERCFNLKRVLAGGLIIALLCTGCGSTVSITNEQNDVIAQYAAGTLLKYSYENEWKYQKLRQKQKTGTSSSTTAGNTTQKSTVGAGTASNTTNSITNKSNTANVTNTGTTGNTTTNNAVSSTTGMSDPMTALANTLELTGATITYSKYEVGDKYPTGEYVLSVPADTGKQIVAVEFTIKNNSSTTITPSVVSNTISMKLTVNSGTAITKSATLLKNDISNLKSVSLTAGEAYTTIALFQVPQDSVANITSMTLAISTGGTSVGTVTLK